GLVLGEVDLTVHAHDGRGAGGEVEVGGAVGDHAAEEGVDAFAAVSERSGSEGGCGCEARDADLEGCAFVAGGVRGAELRDGVTAARDIELDGRGDQR